MRLSNIRIEARRGNYSSPMENRMFALAFKVYSEIVTDRYEEANMEENDRKLLENIKKGTYLRGRESKLHICNNELFACANYHSRLVA